MVFSAPEAFSGLPALVARLAREIAVNPFQGLGLIASL